MSEAQNTPEWPNRPSLTVVPGGNIEESENKDPEGSFFDMEGPKFTFDELSNVLTTVKESLDIRKLYGIGSVVEPTHASQLRHLQHVADIDGGTTQVQQTIADYKRLAHKQYKGTNYDASLPPEIVAEALVAREDNADQRYFAAHLTVLALIHLNEELLEAGKPAMSVTTLRQLNAQLIYSVDPHKFEAFYDAAVQEVNK